MKEIGIFELKTHASRIMQEVLAGKSYIITRRGKPVGRLGPAHTDQQDEDKKRKVDNAFDKLKEIRVQIKPETDPWFKNKKWWRAGLAGYPDTIEEWKKLEAEGKADFD
jgi:prevent-host-death family protein